MTLRDRTSKMSLSSEIVGVIMLSVLVLKQSFKIKTYILERHRYIIKKEVSTVFTESLAFLKKISTVGATAWAMGNVQIGSPALGL